jgi:phage/plasmid-associated DNA primase
MNEAVIKSITGGDEVVAKKLYCDPFTFTPVIKMWILTNKNINFDVSSPAMVKRTKIVPMDAEFSDKPTVGQYRKDPQFVEDLQTIYKDEVFSFIAQGAYEYYKYKSFGDEECESINKYKTEYIDNQDDVKAFLNEKCIIDENLKCKISTTELFEAYIDFCKEHELRMIKREEFYKRLGSKKLNSCKLHGNWYYKHIKLKPFDNSYNEEIIDDDEIIEKEPKSIKCYSKNKIETVSESESDEEEEVIKKEEIIIPVPKKADKKIVVKKAVKKITPKEKILHMIDETDDEHYSDAENIKELF